MIHPLPSGWQEAKLRDILFISSKKYDPQKNKTNYKCIELEHIESDTGILKGYINSNDQLSIKNIFENGDILYGKLRPYLRKFHNAKFNGVCSSEIWVLKGKKVINEFLYYFIQSYKFDHIANISCGTKMPRADWSYMSEINFIIPPLEEQKHIAEVLSLCDDIIENLTELIEKKEQYKKGVMQRLLSGEVRFKGFTDEWKTVRLGDLATITSAGVDKKINTDEKKVRLLNYLDVFNRNKLYDNEISFITSANDTQIEKCNIKKGDLFITPSSEDREGIAKSAVAMEDFDNVVYSYHIIRLRFNKEIDLKFKSYMCDTELFHRQAYRLCDGSGQRYVISLGTFREMKIYIPTSIEEQRKIGEFLSTIDNEIDNLKKQLELRKQQKKGLMQKLLTGEVRI
ncbi:restriction endonuclease subunit S [Brachyspira intermedia]|uniref:restriction endonuclease subunit S n=1 Tax=Brachyspira intermedia TaxID=84377 RepID=UPI003003FC05